MLAVPVKAQSITADAPVASEAKPSRLTPQVEAQLANELLALSRSFVGKDSDLALSYSHAIAVALARLGRTTEALRISPSADDLYSRDFSAHDEIWAATARRKLAVGKTAEARQAAARVESAPLKGGVLAAFAFEALQRDQKSEALAFLAQAVKIGGTAAGRDIRLAVLFARAGETVTAQRIFGRAEAALRRSEDVMSEDFSGAGELSWNQLIQAQIEAGLSKDVVGLVARIGPHSSDALNILTDAGELNAARALANAGKSPTERAQMDIGVAWSLAAHGDAAQARQRLTEAEQSLPQNADGLRDFLLFSSFAWYTAGDKARFEQQLARLGEPGRVGAPQWEWTPLGSLAPRAQIDAANLPEWEARLNTFAARALELSAKPTALLASVTAPALRELSEESDQSGQTETATALLSALEKWMALIPPARDDENSATPHQEIRLYLATAWRKHGQTERSKRWLQQFLGAPPEDYVDRAADSIKAGFVDEGRAYAAKTFQSPKELNTYTLAPAEAEALLNGAPAKESFVEWSRRFPDQRVELLTQFAHALTRPTLQQSGGEDFQLGKYEFDLNR